MIYLKEYKLFENNFEESECVNTSREWCITIYEELKNIISDKQFFTNTYKKVEEKISSIPDPDRTNILNYQYSKSSYTLLDLAISNNDNETIKVLLKYGSNPNISGEENALFYFLYYAQFNTIIFKELVDRIDDITTQDEDGIYIIDYLYKTNLEWFKNNYKDKYDLIIKKKNVKKFKI